MTEFTSWTEAIIFTFIFSFIILVPCFLIARIGSNMIDKLGQFPSKTPIIQMSVFAKLMTIEILTFLFLLAFFQIFS